MTKGMNGPWKNTGAMLRKAGNPGLWRRAKKRAILREAHRLRGIMIQSFNAGGPPGKKWKRLTFFTKLVSWAKGQGIRGRPLMNTGDLRNSHSVVEVNSDTVFVGVHRSARSKGTKGRDKAGRFTRAGAGKGMVSIASVHEHGSKPIYIDTSPTSAKGQRVRKFFRWLFIKTRGRIKPLKKSTVGIVVRIPPRPWIGPIWEQEQDQSARNITRETIAGLGIPGVSNAVR